MKTVKKLLIYFSLILSISACQKDYFEKDINNENNSNINNSGINSMDELLISDNFDWKTTNTLNVQIILPFGIPIQQVKIISADGLKNYFSGYPEDGSYNLTTKITVPSYEEILQLEYGNGLKFETAVAEINGNSLYYDFNNMLKGTTDDCGPCDGGVTSLTLRYEGTEVNATIKVYKDKVQPNKLIHTENNVSNGDIFSFVGTGPDNKMGAKIRITINDDNNNYTEIHTSCSQTILAGMTFGDFYIVAGESKDGGPLCDNTGANCGPCDGQMTSLTLRFDGTEVDATIKVYKDKVQPDKLIHTEYDVSNGDIFSFIGTGPYNKLGAKIRITINDDNNNYTEIHTSCSQPIEVGMTFGDFYIVAGESKDGGPLCDNTGGGGSTVEIGGYLAYEDLWPAKGDYDFNDLVIDYNFSITKNDQEEIENITATFITKAFGASYLNGFGFSFPDVAPNNIITASGYDIGAGSIFNLDANGLESGQSDATIIVFDNAYRIMQHPGMGIGVNTEHSAPFVTPDTIVMQIVFMENGVPAPGGPVTYSELDIGNFNPFIVVNQDRGKEVHLPDYPPTDLVDEGYFGTINDDSNPAQGRYYKTVNNLPWAIHIPESFDHPIEKQDIIGAYLKFAEWAESDGVLYPDWYQDQPGYRNEDLIY